jgi:phosphohistidine phosphatase
MYAYFLCSKSIKSNRFVKNIKMKLFLIRHGKTEQLANSDKERNLLAKGINQSAYVAEYFMENKIEFDQIFVSNANRTRQTFATIAAIHHCVDPMFDAKLYLCESDIINDFLIENIRQKSGNVLLVGHNNGLSDFASLLTKNYVGLRTGEMVVVEIDPNFSFSLYGYGKIETIIRLE